MGKTPDLNENDFIRHSLLDEQEEDPDGISSKGRKALRSIGRDLEPDDLKSPGVQKMLLDTIDRLEEEKWELRQSKEDFHTADTNLKVMDEKLKQRTFVEIMYSVCLMLSGVLISLSFRKELDEVTSYFLLSTGVVLSLSSIFARYIGRK